MCADIPVRVLKTGIRNDERWTFKDALISAASHRERALLAAASSDPERLDPDGVSRDLHLAEVLRDDELFDSTTVISRDAPPLLLEVDREFPDIDHRALDPKNWKPVVAALVYPEPVHLCEARALLCTVKHASRNAKAHGSHVLVIGDNMSVVLAASKGRCSDYPLLRVLQRVCVLRVWHLVSFSSSMDTV